MDFTEPKRKLQFPPEQEDDEENYGLGDSKWPRMEDNGDEIGMFFALVDRIRATNKMMKQKRAIFDPAEAASTAPENMEAKRMTRKSPWKPSFEWEDFSHGNIQFGGNCGSSNVRDFGNSTASVSKRIPKPDIGSGEDRKVCLSEKHRLVGSFDLNAEAPSEHPVPSTP